MDGMDAVNDFINSGGVPELADVVAKADVSKRQRVEHSIHLLFEESSMPMDVEPPKSDRDHRMTHVPPPVGPWQQPPPQMQGNNNHNGPWARGNGPPSHPPHGGGGGGQFHGNAGPPRRPNNNNGERNRGGRWGNRR